MLAGSSCWQSSISSTRTSCGANVRSSSRILRRRFLNGRNSSGKSVVQEFEAAMGKYSAECWAEPFRQKSRQFWFWHFAEMGIFGPNMSKKVCFGLIQWIIWGETATFGQNRIFGFGNFFLPEFRFLSKRRNHFRLFTNSLVSFDLEGRLDESRTDHFGGCFERSYPWAALVHVERSPGTDEEPVDDGEPRHGEHERRLVQVDHLRMNRNKNEKVLLPEAPHHYSDNSSHRLQGSRYFLGHKGSVSFVLKCALPPPSGMQVLKQNTHAQGTFDLINNLALLILLTQRRMKFCSCKLGKIAIATRWYTVWPG